MNIRTLAEITQQILHSGPVAAGQTLITPSTPVDLTSGGFRGCLFIVHWGAITAAGVQSATVNSSATSGGSYAAITGATVTVADDDDNKLSILQVVDPPNPFLKCLIARATQDSAINGIIAIPFNGRLGVSAVAASVANRGMSNGNVAQSVLAVA